MKKSVVRIGAVLLTLVLLLPVACAQTASEADYTVEEKLLKQLEAGSGFFGTLTVESAAVAGREGDALTTLSPLMVDLNYIYVRADTATGTKPESRLTLALTNGEKTSGLTQVSLREGTFYLTSALLGDGWYSLGTEDTQGNDATAATDTPAPSDATAATDTPAPGDATAATDTPAPSAATGKLEAETAANGNFLTEGIHSWLAQSAMPGLAAFALSLPTRLYDADATQLMDALDPYTTKIDLWIEGYRQKATLGKLADGTSTMEVAYDIPDSAVKAQLKQMLMDVLGDEDLLPLLQATLSAEDAARYLNPALQSYYFAAIDTLPMNGDLEINRTVSLKGDTILLSLSLPLYDSQGGAVTLRYNRQRGEQDLPDENTLSLQSDRLLLELAYQTYQTLDGTAVYDGTFLRVPQGEAATGSDALRTLSAAFTLSAKEASALSEDGKDTMERTLELTLTPDYTPDDTADETAEPTEAQAAQYVTFDPLDLKLDWKLSSGQAKNASTAVDATLVITGERLPETITLTFSGKTKGKWTPEHFTPGDATPLRSLGASELTALAAQAGVRGGLLLLPYVNLPSAQTTVTAQPSTTEMTNENLQETINPTPSETPQG